MRSRLLTLSLTAAAASSVSTSASAPSEPLLRPHLTVHEGFLSSDEVDSIVRSVRLLDSSDPSVVGGGGGTRYGPTVLPLSISERLRDLGGTCGLLGGGGGISPHEGEGGEAVMTMHMTSTTDRHQDCHVPQSEGQVVSRGDVAFVFLDSDPEARFEHGDDDDGEAAPAESVSVVKGNLVKFRGDVPHRTVVPPGSSVRIVGPFHLPTMEYVGSCPEGCKDGDGNTCNGGAYWTKCECYGDFDDDRRALEKLERETTGGAKDRAMDELKNLSLTQGFLRNVVAAGQSRDLDECRAYTCREGIGACCKTDDSTGASECDDNSEPRGCMQQNKIFMGHGSVCVSKTTCPPLQGISPEDAELGFCCSTSSNAPFTMRGYCDDILNGYFVPSGGRCPDPNEMGACCKPNKCTLTPVEGCTGDGEWKTAGTKCKDVCEGACCSAEMCEIVTEKGHNDGVSCTSGTFNVGQDCMATSCTERCEETLKNAEIIKLPDELGDVTFAPGSTVDGDIDNAQDFVEDCEEAILPAGSQWHTFVGNGRKLTITTCSDVVPKADADHGNFLSLYKDSCANLTCAELDETSDECTDGNGYTIKICAEPGVKFGLMVHGYGSLCSESEGNYTIAIRDDGSCVPTQSPTSRPTENPTKKPTPTPTNDERPPETTTPSPTKNPTAKPTPTPTNDERPPETTTPSPTKNPTAKPTETPTRKPTDEGGRIPATTTDPGNRPPGECDCDCICACECGCIEHSGKGKGGTSWGKGGKGGGGKGGTNWSGIRALETNWSGNNWSAGKGSGGKGGSGKGGSGKGSSGKGGTNWSAPRTSWPGDECNPTTCECECEEPTHTNWPSHPGKGKGGKGGSGKGGTNWSGIRALETNWSGKGKGGTNWSGKGGKGYGKGYCGGKGGKGEGKGGTSWGKGGSGKGGTNWSGIRALETNWSGTGTNWSAGKGKGGSGKGGTNWSGTKPPGGSCVCHGNGKGGKGGKGGTTWSGKGKGGTNWSGKGKGGTNWSTDYIGSFSWEGGD